VSDGKKRNETWRPLVAGLLDLGAQGMSHSERADRGVFFPAFCLRCPQPLGHKLRANVWEASHIVDEIYLGSVDDAANLEALRDVKGITHIVCCVLGECSCVLPVSSVHHSRVRRQQGCGRCIQASFATTWFLCVTSPMRCWSPTLTRQSASSTTHSRAAGAFLSTA
jgi:hypothetical protein